MSATEGQDHRADSGRGVGRSDDRVRADGGSRERGAAAARALRRGTWTGLDQASVMGVELLAAILTWAGIGWLVDRWLGTAPWFLAIGALVGNGAGLRIDWFDPVSNANSRSRWERPTE